MFARLRRSRRLRLLLAVGLVPIVVFGNPATATAANDWEQVHITPDIPGMPDTDCYLNLQHTDDGQTMNLGGNSYCSGGVDITPGESQEGEQGSPWGISVTGFTPAGDQACAGNATGTFGSHSSSGIFNVAGSFGASQIAMSATETGCVVKEVCLFLTSASNPDNSTEDCVPVDMAPLLQDQECEYGDVLGVELVSHYEARASNPGITDYWWEVQVFFTNGAGEHYDKWRISKNTSYSTDQTAWGVSMAGDALSFSLLKNGIASSGDIQGGLANTKPKGIQVYALDNVRNTGTTYDPSALTNATSTSPSMPDGGYRGLTMPSYCRFYWGQRVLDDPGSILDDPMGPLDDYPYVPPDASGPEPTYDPVEVIPEPVDSEPSFWSIVGGLLRLILAAIKALGSAIANIATLILDGLKDLLVPSDGFMDSEFRDLKQAWDETTPGRYVGAIEGMTAGVGSGCGGLPLNLSLPGGVMVNESIGAACGGKMQEVAYIVKMVLSAGLVVGGTFACVRALGSGFGWNPGIGGKTD